MEHSPDSHNQDTYSVGAEIVSSLTVFSWLTWLCLRGLNFVKLFQHHPHSIQQHPHAQQDEKHHQVQSRPSLIHNLHSLQKRLELRPVGHITVACFATRLERLRVLWVLPRVVIRIFAYAL